MQSYCQQCRRSGSWQAFGPTNFCQRLARLRPKLSDAGKRVQRWAFVNHEHGKPFYRRAFRFKFSIGRCRSNQRRSSRGLQFWTLAPGLLFSTVAFGRLRLPVIGNWLAVARSLVEFVVGPVAEDHAGAVHRLLSLVEVQGRVSKSRQRKLISSMPRDSAVADTFEGGDNLNRLFVVLFTKPSGSRDGSATKIYHKAYRSAVRN